ncbi:MAG TPA: hypothetical protein VFJ93_06175, partial [Gaiellaceae bacterium]|nr:hypothetical protein [Gaiellaceae bacterium]
RLFGSTVSPHAFVIDEAGVVLDRLVPGSMADLELLARRQRTEDAASQVNTYCCIGCPPNWGADCMYQLPCGACQ